MEPTPAHNLQLQQALTDAQARRAFSLHDRIWQHNKYVYPVVSRRSKGLSLGVNLNPDKICNFDCIYCSVDRRGGISKSEEPIDLAQLSHELDSMLALAASGEIYHYDPFDKIPPLLARVNDIAFSGDGEPTTCPQLLDVCHLAAQLKDTYFPNSTQHPPVKMVLITNATMLHRPLVSQALGFLDQHDGEIWAKLDAGTEEYYQLVDRSAVRLETILKNIKAAAEQRPLVIQSLFMKVHGQVMPSAERAAYISRLQEILALNPKAIKLVQAYTVARYTTETYATALELSDLENIAHEIQARIPHLPVEVYP